MDDPLLSLSVDALRTEEAKLVQSIEIASVDLESQIANLSLLSTTLNETASYPVSTLPAELLSDIFLLAIMPGEDGLGSRTLACRRFQAPIPFLRVCKRWTAVAVGTARLWQTISVRLDAIGNGAYLFATWAKRARSLPLTLVLWVDISWDPRRAPSLAFGQVLQALAARIQHLLLDVAASDIEFLNSLAPAFSSLTTLDVVSYDDPPPSLFLRSTPSLRTLLIELTSPYSLDLSWVQLTTVHLVGLPIETCLVVLSLGRNLLNVHLHPIRKASRATLALLGVRTYNSITSLNVEEGEDDEDAPVNATPSHTLEFLTLPNLRSLTIDHDEDLPPRTFADFIRRSSSPLRSLTMTASTGPLFGSWSSGLLPFRNLRIRYLGIQQVAVQFLQQFFDVIRSDVACLVDLEELHIQCREVDMFRYGDFVIRLAFDAIIHRKRVRGRTSSPCCLRTFNLLSDGSRDIEVDMGTDPTLLDSLLTLQSDELSLSVYVGTLGKSAIHIQ